MYTYKQITWNGYPVHIVEAKSDATHDIQLTIMADKFGTAGQIKSLADFKDAALEAKGGKLIAAVNGGLFFPEGATVFSLGIEKVNGVIHENDDISRDGTYALAEYNNMPYIATQAYLKSRLQDFRGAITAGTGLLDNGAKKVGTYASGVAYWSKSGRTIIGKTPDGRIIFATISGVTGSTGITIPQAQSLAIYLGMNNAVCMDGGGSASMRYEGAWKAYTSRKIKNAVGIYAFTKVVEVPVETLKAGDKVTIDGKFTVGNVVGAKAYITELAASIDQKYLKKV